MKISVIIVSLFLLLKPIFPVVDYVVNYDYISKVLCVNKAKPQMHCNGKCHLMKQLAKEAESEKPISSDKKNGTAEFETLFFQHIQSFELLPFYELNTSCIAVCYNDLYSYLNSNTLYHPPIFNV